jgi:CRP/FNR family transcriptional regulator, cyclic AMP receptor protein
VGRKPAKTEFDPQAFLAKVGAGKAILKIKRNQHVFEQGDVAGAVFYIQKGRVKLTVLSEQGKEAVVGILEPGQFFGEGCLNGHTLRIATTTAMEECVITSITKEAMIAALRSEPKFSELFMAYLLTRNSRVEEDLIDQLFNSSEKRLARLLPPAREFRKGRRTSAYSIGYQPGNIGRDDWNDPISRQLLHEQIPQTWTHQLQWKDRSSQFAVERRFA